MKKLLLLLCLTGCDDRKYNCEKAGGTWRDNQCVFLYVPATPERP